MKLKRLLTGVLSAVMALSVCAMPALADENNAATPTTGSLTITKYEQPKGTTGDDWQEKDIGNPLAGVTFTVYKVAEVNQTVDASGNVSLSYDLVDTLKNGGVSINWDSYLTETEPKQYDSARIFNILYGQLTENDKTLKSWSLFSKSAITNDKGEAKFDSLETGVYMVEETSAPTQITSRTANFMVSIPMTVTKENGTQEITYNVEAKPKNVSTYGGVTLNKYGQVAGDNTTKAAIAGAVFQLYRDNGTEDASNWKTVDLTARGIKVDGEVVAVTDENAKIGKVTTTTTGVNIAGLTPGKYKFMEISAPAGYIADTKTEHKFKLDDNGDVWVDNAKVDDRVVEVVNEKPDFEKTVAERGKTTSVGNHDADYGIDDLIPYTLTVKVPTTIANLKTFYVTDSINTEQLAYEQNTVTVSCSDNVPITKDINYTITFEPDGSGFKIDFKPDGKTGLTADFAGKTITITYKAKLQSGAKVDKSGNINNAELIYSNKTNTVAEEGSKDIDKIQDEAVVYTFQTSIMKTGSDGAKLAGVKFDLYKKYDATTDGTIADSSITFRNGPCPVIDGEAAYKLKLNSTASSNDKWILVKKDMTTADGGAAIEKGLPKGDYYLVETETKPGYNLLSEPVKADLSIQYAAKWTESKEYTDGVLTKHTYNKDETTFDSTAAAKVINIVNRKGFTLPVTGGFGTLLFSGIGVLLVLAGVCVLFSMKKKNNRA